MEYKKVNQNVNNIVNEQVKKLAQVFPAAVKDGEVDFDALKEELGLFTEVGPEKYELTWAGKADAKRIAKEDIVGKTLKFIPEDSKNADTTENLYIEGDNLEVLKLLRQNYYGAIKMIYIDPPYNTGKDFVYKDNFKMTEEESLISDGVKNSQGERFVVNSSSQNRFHANWMNMMYPRLQIAKDLLKESGLIFISISDIEISNLRILCDEIFGASNFVVDLIWANKEGGGSSDSKLFRIKHEHILCYAKNIAEVQVIGVPVGNEDRYKSEDEYVRERGKYYLQKLGMGSIQYSQSLDYPIEVPDGTTVMPADNNGGKKACWRWSKQKYEWGKTNGFIEIKKDNSGQWTVYTKQYLNCDNDGNIIERTQRPMGIIDEYSSTQAAKMLESMGLGKYFNYSKPYDLIKYLISRIECDDEIILDFFSGSGTTAHSVICSNEEDSKRRKFILVQFPELLNENTDAYQEGYRTICDLGKERIRSIEERMNISSNCDTGFKVFRVADTNIKWNSLMDKGQLDVSQIESTPDLMDFMPNTIRFKTFRVSGGASLEELSGGLPQYKNYRVAEQPHKLKPLQIATPDGFFALDMEHSNHEIEKNEAVRIQIRLAIQNHFAKQIDLLRKGRKIKALTLFFIDAVDKVRDSSASDGRGEYLRIFDEEYLKYVNANRGILVKYIEYFPQFEEVLKVRKGYFARDKKNNEVDVEGWDSSLDENAMKIKAKSQEDIDRGIELILERKDELISFDEPLAFIFSHSALREGWDNPNVFTLCTLKAGGSEIAKKQEIGRGLRLPVDITGNRCLDRRLNELTVIANDYYDHFAAALQSDFNDNMHYDKNEVTAEVLISTLKAAGVPVGKINPELVDTFKEELVSAGVMNSENILKGSATQITKIFDEMNFVNETLHEHEELIKKQFKQLMVQKGTKKIEIRNSDNEPYQNEVRAYVTEGEFEKIYLGLRQNLMKRTIYKFKLDKEKFIDDCILEINNKLRFMRAKNEYKIETGKAKFNDSQMFVMEEAHYGDQELEIEISSEAKSDFEIANYIMYHTMLPRLAIFRILQGIEKRELLNNQDILDEITQFMLEKLNDAKAENITSYEVINGYELDSRNIFELDTISEEDFEESWKVFKAKSDRSSAMNEYYKMDSEGEFEFAHRLENNTNVLLFTKIKKGGFVIDTPYGNYSPDWAVVCRKESLTDSSIGATIDGLVRRESYELPAEAIREMIINAHCHRNLLDESCIQVAVYDDRLEVTSPGGLYNGLTYEEVMSGHSKIRNKVIANVFSQMGLVESWGSGIRRILNAAEEYKLPVPKVEVFDDMFRVNLYRNEQDNMNGSIGDSIGENIGDGIGKNIGDRLKNDKIRLNDTQVKILENIAENKYLSAAKLAEITGISKRNVENNIKKLKEAGILIRHGSPKSGYWEIVE